MNSIHRWPKIELPNLQFALPEDVGAPDTVCYQGMVERLERLAHQAGTESASFRRRMQQLDRLLRSNKRIDEIVQTPKDIRVLVKIWQENPAAIKQSPIERSTLRHFTTLRPRQSLLTLFSLIQIFFERFDEVDDLEAFSAFLQAQLRLNAGRQLSQTLFRLAEHVGDLFAVEGPIWVVRYAQRAGLTLPAAAASLGLPIEREGRFFTQCKNVYYLSTLEKLQIGQNHEVLSEVVQKHVFECIYKGGWLVGHKVLQILIEKVSASSEMPDHWLRVILNIAGDPRVSTRMPNYVRWWALLGDAYVRKVRQWLSRIDLDLFLKILEDYAKNSGDIEMQRMFPARRRLLEGIFAKRLVNDSRLFLSRHAQTYLRRNYKHDDLPTYSQLKNSSCSVIYLNIDGKYVIEGTHNFSMWIYQRLPTHNPVEDYERHVVDVRELGVGLYEQYEAEYGINNVTNIKHISNWQQRVISTLRELGTNINPSDVLTSEDYRHYRTMYGVET